MILNAVYTKIRTPSMRTRVTLFSLLVTYRIFLDLSYKDVATIYEYQGLFLNDGSNYTFALSWLLFLFFIPHIMKQFEEEYLSNYFIVLIALFSLIPQIVSIAYRSDYSFEYIFLMITYWLLLLKLHHYIKPIRINFKPNQIIQKFPAVLLFILIATVFIYSFLKTGLRLHFDFYDVYAIRAEAREFSIIFPFNYMLTFADNVLAFFAVLLIYKRRYLLCGLTIFVIFINFSIAGTKGVLFILICGILGYFFIRTPKKLVRILFAAIALCFFALLEYKLFEISWLTFIFSYRLLFLPVSLHNSYFSFFQMNEIDLYRQSLLKFFFDSPYNESIQFLIGDYAINDITARANNGLFSDAYMNLGSLGIFIYPLLLVILLRLFDGAASRINTRLWPVISIYLALVLISIPLSTAMLTSGLFLFLILLYTFPKADSSTNRNTF